MLTKQTKLLWNGFDLSTLDSDTLIGIIEELNEENELLLKRLQQTTNPEPSPYVPTALYNKDYIYKYNSSLN